MGLVYMVVGQRIRGSKSEIIAERVEQQKKEDAERTRHRTIGLAWLADASYADIDEAEASGGFESRGLSWSDLREELQRRELVRLESSRAATWDRCRSSFQDGAILVNDGSPSTPGKYGPIKGRDSHVYYGCRVMGCKFVEDAVVLDASRASVGTLAQVAEWIASGWLRVASADEVPPEPVVRRIGHDRFRQIIRAEVAGHVVWVGSPLFKNLLVLNAAGKIVRARAVRDAALAAYDAALAEYYGVATSYLTGCQPCELMG